MDLPAPGRTALHDRPVRHWAPVPLPAPASRTVVLLAVLAFIAVWVAAAAFRAVHPAPSTLDLGWDGLAGVAPGSLLHGFATAMAVIGTGVPAVLVTGAVALAIGTVRGWSWTVFTVVASLISEVDVLALKVLAMRARPDSAFGIGTSFPSGHTANAALLGTVVLLLVPNVAARIGAVVFMLVMAWSRTAIHAHWLTDVIGGLAIGAATALLLFVPFRALVDPARERRSVHR